jgi:hypothetical protein
LTWRRYLDRARNDLATVYVKCTEHGSSATQPIRCPLASAIARHPHWRAVAVRHMRSRSRGTLDPPAWLSPWHRPPTTVDHGSRSEVARFFVTAQAFRALRITGPIYLSPAHIRAAPPSRCSEPSLDGHRRIRPRSPPPAPPSVGPNDQVAVAGEFFASPVARSRSGGRFQH